MPDAERARRAAQALAVAKADARARGDFPVRPQAARPADDDLDQGLPGKAGEPPQPGQPGTGEGQNQPERGSGAGLPLRSARRRPRRDDPQPLTSAIGGLLDQQGWRLAAATGSVFSRWAEIVGADLAGHTRPETLADGELTVTADSTAWATQVRLLASQLVRRLNAELGDGTVQRVKVRGPAAPRQAGQLRVRGARGPRDTYG